MAPPARPVPSVSGILEQLDELEALMRRMLALPVEPTTDEPKQANPVEASALQRDKTDEVATVGVVAATQDQPARSEERKEQARPVRVAPIGPRPLSLEPRMPPWMTKEPFAPPREPAAERPAAWRWPLLGIEHGFQRFTHCLGSLGRWLDGDPGRVMLGAVGVLLVLGALSWGIWDWLGTGQAGTPLPDAANLAPAGAGR